MDIGVTVLRVTKGLYETDSGHWRFLKQYYCMLVCHLDEIGRSHVIFDVLTSLEMMLHDIRDLLCPCMSFEIPQPEDQLQVSLYIWLLGNNSIILPVLLGWKDLCSKSTYLIVYISLRTIQARGLFFHYGCWTRYKSLNVLLLVWYLDWLAELTLTIYWWHLSCIFA